MKQLNFRHLSRNIIHCGKNYYVTTFFKQLMKEIESRYSHIKFETKNSPEYEKFGYGGIHSCMSMSVINPANDKYILFSFFDNWKYHFMQHMGWKPQKMVQFHYAAGFNFLDYHYFKHHNSKNPDTAFPKNIDEVYTPMFYSSYYDCCYDTMQELYEKRKTQEQIDKLFFRGYMWDFRESMSSDLMQQKDVLIIDKNKNDQNIDYIAYLKEISRYKCCLSLPGGTEICNRDIECFGVGVPVLRPLITTNYSEPLIPNYHYISCYHSCDYMDGGNPKFLNYNDMQANTMYIWNRIKNNHEFLNFISQNARSWFERNCGMNNNIKHTMSKINLELLK